MAKKQKNKSGLKLLIIALVVAILVVGGGVILVKNVKDTKSVSQQSDTNNTKALKQEENQFDNQHKAALATGQKNSNSETSQTSANNTTANVHITSAQESGSTVTVSSYVANIFENGGTCTLSLTNGSTTITRQDTGIENVSYTTCPTFSINNSGNSVLSSGTWKATVSYSSSDYQGASSATSLEVQ